MKECFICEIYSCTEKHHCFGGTANRKLSEKYNLTVDLCPSCHREGPEAVHGKNGKNNMQRLHEYGQRKFMRDNNATIPDFVRIFGKNYLNEEW